jgi:cellobiose phosphorylase
LTAFPEFATLPGDFATADLIRRVRNDVRRVGRKGDFLSTGEVPNLARALRQTLKEKHTVPLQGDCWAFSEDGREFSFTKRDMKMPWKNLIFTDQLKSTVMPTGSGAVFDRSPVNDCLCPDNNPRLVVVRDQDSGESWSVNGAEGAAPADWKCTHGFGYTRLSSTRHEIAGRVTYFVAVDETTEIWRIRLENVGGRARSLRVFPLALWRFGLIGYETGFDDVSFADNMIVGTCKHWPFVHYRTTNNEFERTWDRVGFMASSPAPSGFDCVLEEFVGDGGFGVNADAIRAGACRNSTHLGLDSCGVLQVDVNLAPGAAVDLVVLVGMAKDAGDAARIRAKYGTPAQADAAFAALKKWWADYLGRIQIEVPDRDLTLFANNWHRYNMFTRYYSRFGVRDTGQDMGAVAAYDPQRALARLTLILETQYQDGCTRHDVDLLGSFHHRTINSDLPLWLTWLTARYIRETGDYGLLDRKFRYVEGTEGTAYEHCVRAIDYIRQESGRFGLPLTKCGDWNDCLVGSAKTGVSVWMGLFYHCNLMEMYELAKRTGRTADAERFLAQAKALATSINQNCWDGRWYTLAYDDEGGVIGSHTEEEGRIWINPQTWAVMSGVAPADRARTCLEAVQELMDTPVGIPLMAPPYTKIQKRIGMITRYAPGHHHNGSSWHHGVTWTMLAECKIGRADRALQLFRMLFPPYMSNKWDEHKTEPYTYASYTNTPPSGQTGRTGIPWNSGTVCWMYRVLLEGFAGITPEHDGLRIAPSLPAEWRKITVKRPYRGSVYHITIEAPPGVTQGVKEITVNGQPVAGHVVPVQPAGQEVAVRVTMG